MTMNIRIDTKGALLNGQAPAIIQQNLERFVNQATKFLVAEVKSRTPQGVSGYQGGLAATINDEVTGKGTPLVKGVVFHTSKHGDVIEKGRAAGKGIPIDALTRWVQVKLGVTDPVAIKRVAIIISTRAKKYGIKGKFMFEKALSENTGKLEAMAQSAGLKIAVELDK